MTDKNISNAVEKYLLEESSILYIILNREGKIVQANRYAEKLIGADICNKFAADIIVDFNQTFNLSQLIEDSSKMHLLNISTVDGVPLTFYFHFYDLSETIVMVGELNNLELVSLKKNLLSLNNELNNLTRELQKKNVELLKLNDLKNQFLGIAAHDLRNPIHVIKSFSEFLLTNFSDSITSDQSRFLSIIKTSSETMSHLIDDLLDITKIESGKLELDLKSTNIANLITYNVSLNQVLAERKKITILLTYDTEIPELTVDGPKIDQVMNNLISNAVKYSHTNKSVYVKISNQDEKIIVSVQDEGLGIPQDELQKLFKPFSKTSVTGTAGELSTGLGLAIVRKIIEGHHGQIWVESKVGKGSIFYFSLPINHK